MWLVVEVIYISKYNLIIFPAIAIYSRKHMSEAWCGVYWRRCKARINQDNFKKWVQTSIRLIDYTLNICRYHYFCIPFFLFHHRLAVLCLCHWIHCFICECHFIQGKENKMKKKKQVKSIMSPWNIKTKRLCKS